METENHFQTVVKVSEIHACVKKTHTCTAHVRLTWVVTIKLVFTDKLYLVKSTVTAAQVLPSRTEPAEAEMLSERRCSRKRGKKLLLKWQ